MRSLLQSLCISTADGASKSALLLKETRWLVSLFLGNFGVLVRDLAIWVSAEGCNNNILELEG